MFIAFFSVCRNSSDVSVSIIPIRRFASAANVTVIGVSVFNASADQAVPASFVSAALIAYPELSTSNLTVFWTANLSVISDSTAQVQFGQHCAVEVVPVTAGRHQSSDDGSSLPVVISTTTAAGLLLVGLAGYVYKNL